MEILLVLIILFVVLGIAAWRWGFDSTEKIDSPEWERRTTWRAHPSSPNSDERKQTPPPSQSPHH